MKKLALLLIFLTSIYKVSGQGTCAGVHFTPIAQYPVALGANYSFSSFIIGSGDFDNDGKQDLAFIGTHSYTSTHVILQRNIRTGSLPSQVSFDTSVSVFARTGTMDFVVNDFNNDGKPDLAITFGSYSGLDSLEILINNGTSGTFTFFAMPIIALSSGEIYPTLKTGDFDHDGKQDLMYQGTDNKLYVLLNAGFTSTSASFASTSSYTGITFYGSTSGTYRSYAQGDMNGDSLAEVAFPGYSSYSGSDTMFVYKNTSTKGAISFKLAQAYICPDQMATGMFWDGNYVQIRDLNGDKKADISVLYDNGGKQKLLFLKNNGTGSAVSVTFSDTMQLNHFTGSPYSYKLNDTGLAMSADPYIDFSDFSLIYNDPCKLKPDILLSVEGAGQTYSLISYLANTSTLSKITYSAPCWFDKFTSDRASVGDFNGDGKDDLMSMCDVCIPGTPNYGLSISENVSTIKTGNQTLLFDTVSVQCQANKTGGMKIKLYLPCHALVNLAKDSVVLAWSPKVSTSDTATLVFGAKYSVHIYNQSKKYDTTITLAFSNPYHIGQNGVPIRVLFTDTTICPGAPIVLAMAKANKINHYLWTPNVAINNDTSYSPTVTPTITTVYHVSGSGGECLRDTSITVRVHLLPVIMANPVDTTVCPGSPVKLAATGANIYVWTPKRHLSNDSGAITYAKVDSTTTFNVDGYDGKCHGIVSVTVVTIAAPVVNAGQTWTLHSNETHTINDASVTGGYFRYWWTPALYMNDSTLINPTVSNPISMWYYLHSVNAYGCMSEDSVYIKFDPFGHIFVPDAFTPNGDGVNDNLKVQKENIRTYHLEIYNRWGQIVFVTESPLKDWDGRFNGEMEPVGSYVYLIQATDIGGHAINMKGNITLLR